MLATDLLDRRHKVHPDTFLEAGPDGTFLLTPDGQTLRLNEVAASIWTGVEAGQTVAEVLAAIQTEFAVPSPAVAEGDLTEFLELLLQAGLVTADS